MKTTIIAILLVVLNLAHLDTLSQNRLITNTQSRRGVTLNGVWKYVVDPYELGFYDYRLHQRDLDENPGGAEAFFMNYKPQNPWERVEYDFSLSDNILVPRDWNSQKEKLFYYEGTVWYYKEFDYDEKNKNSRQFVYFGAANYSADVYLNTKKLGTHKGGFTPFNFEITNLLKPKGNFLIVKVDNKRSAEKVPTVNTDWWNYGGLTRDVKIIEVPSTYIRDYYIQLKDNTPDSIVVQFYLEGNLRNNQNISVSIPEAKIDYQLQTNANGVASATIAAPELTLWSPQNPKLYNVQIVMDDELINDKIGFRTIETHGADILLNGESVFLRGISIHEENPIRGGRAYSEHDARMLLNWAKELGCNFVRLAHYPHNENMTRIADEIGLMVWSEVPVYWTIQWENKNTYNNAREQLVDMITRDKNRASVIVWSVANETPVSEPRNVFLKNLIHTARLLDPVRFVSCAMERHTKPGTEFVEIIDDPLQEYVDIIAFNQYIGWYDGTPQKCKNVEFDIQFDKPVIISEFGGGALQGKHGDKMELWTEEYQEFLYVETLLMLDKIPQFRGLTPWILTDFRSPRRLLPDIQDNWNRKGLISETGNKKKAFYILQKFYGQKQKQYSN